MYLYTSSRVQHVSGKVLRASTETKGELSWTCKGQGVVSFHMGSSWQQKFPHILPISWSSTKQTAKYSDS